MQNRLVTTTIHQSLLGSNEAQAKTTWFLRTLNPTQTAAEKFNDDFAKGKRKQKKYTDHFNSCFPARVLAKTVLHLRTRSIGPL